jgi:hypothetical protein
MGGGGDVTATYWDMQYKPVIYTGVIPPKIHDLIEDITDLISKGCILNGKKWLLKLVIAKVKDTVANG